MFMELNFEMAYKITDFFRFFQGLVQYTLPAQVHYEADKRPRFYKGIMPFREG